VTGLARIAQDAGEGTGVHTCRSGGRTTLDAATVSERRGDTIVTSSRWQFVTDECRFTVMVSGKPHRQVPYLCGRGDPAFGPPALPAVAGAASLVFKGRGASAFWKPRVPP